MLSKLWLFAPVWLLDYYFQTNRSTALMLQRCNSIKRTEPYLRVLAKNICIFKGGFSSLIILLQLYTYTYLHLPTYWSFCFHDSEHGINISSSHIKVSEFSTVEYFFSATSQETDNVELLSLSWCNIWRDLTCSACMYFPTSIKIPKYLQPLYSSHENIEWRHFV